MRMCSNQEEGKLGGIGRLISERLNKNSYDEKYPTKQAGLLQWRRLLCPVFASRDDVLHEAAKPERQSPKPTVVVRVPLLCSFLHLRERPPIHSPARLWSHETSFFPPPSSLERRVQFPLLEYSKQEGHKRANSQLRLGRQQVLRNMDEKWGNIPMDTNFGSCIIESAMIVACLTDVSIRPSPVFLK